HQVTEDRRSGRSFVCHNLKPPATAINIRDCSRATSPPGRKKQNRFEKRKRKSCAAHNAVLRVCVGHGQKSEVGEGAKTARRRHRG
ncbi:unnamed protein product, partial [Amoebophrya sp. A120]